MNIKGITPSRKTGLEVISFNASAKGIRFRCVGRDDHASPQKLYRSSAAW